MYNIQRTIRYNSNVYQIPQKNSKLFHFATTGTYSGDLMAQNFKDIGLGKMSLNRLPYLKTEE